MGPKEFFMIIGSTVAIVVICWIAISLLSLLLTGLSYVSLRIISYFKNKR